jgi:ferredoxin
MSPITITVEQIGTLPWQGQHSLLEALEDAGVDISYSCRSGACAACKVTLLAGNIQWRTQPAVSIHGKEILACSVVPLTDIKIALPD